MSADTEDRAEKNVVDPDPARYRFRDQRHVKNPFDVWKQIRETPGLVRSEQDGGFWILSRFDEVRRAAAQERTFCARRGRVIPSHPGTFLPSDTDGALHRQYRRILNRWLSADAVSPFEAKVRATCAGRLAPLAAEDVAGPGASARPWSELSRYITQQLERREGEPRREDVLQRVLDAEIDGRPVTHDEALQLIISVFLGAAHTTASTLSYSLHYLANHPRARDRLRCEPDRLELAVEARRDRGGDCASGSSRVKMRPGYVGRLQCGGSGGCALPWSTRCPSKQADGALRDGTACRSTRAPNINP